MQRAGAAPPDFAALKNDQTFCFKPVRESHEAGKLHVCCTGFGLDVDEMARWLDIHWQRTQRAWVHPHTREPMCIADVRALRPRRQIAAVVAPMDQAGRAALQQAQAAWQAGHAHEALTQAHACLDAVPDCCEAMEVASLAHNALGRDILRGGASAAGQHHLAQARQHDDASQAVRRGDMGAAVLRRSIARPITPATPLAAAHARPAVHAPPPAVAPVTSGAIGRVPRHLWWAISRTTYARLDTLASALAHDHPPFDAAGRAMVAWSGYAESLSTFDGRRLDAAVRVLDAPFSERFAQASRGLLGVNDVGRALASVLHDAPVRAPRRLARFMDGATFVHLRTLSDALRNDHSQDLQAASLAMIAWSNHMQALSPQSRQRLDTVIRIFDEPLSQQWPRAAAGALGVNDFGQEIQRCLRRSR